MNKMIGYYLSTGDEEVSNMFSPYVWKENGLDTLMDLKLAKKNYGDDLDLLLIQYYVEGKFSSYLPEEPKVGNYLKKNKDIAVAIAVTRDVFHDRNEFERREFIVNSTLNAIELVRKRLIKKKLDIDFDSLIRDVKELAYIYLKREEPYSKV
ncbi:hypothetical protein [Dyadobacter jejuensis]|nr:hypothetical protein [Dyadobacter jejuensis]